ncbi:hypothetical protein L3X38_037136 [Prunus dulcis]|uniref:Integrase zinc-binding domain-containing protein n=1 Tax=Prunus dulcis TaxID=3755 RepID=A0AAD4V2T5_PRUDU|nr:hypothetical protein L3X38_037136 [Prunus dulcis]
MSRIILSMTWNLLQWCLLSKFGRITCMVELIKDYDCTIEHHPGQANVVADALSGKGSGNLAHLRMAYLPLLVELRKDSVDLEMTQQGGILASWHVRPILAERVIIDQLEDPNMCVIRLEVENGSTKMYRTLREYYLWPHMKGYIAKYVSRCLICQQVKAKRYKPSRLMQPLSIPEWKWEHITMNFVFKLPHTSKGHDGIWVIVDPYLFH